MLAPQKSLTEKLFVQTAKDVSFISQAAFWKFTLFWMFSNASNFLE